jgi:hypothetical protein
MDNINIYTLAEKLCTDNQIDWEKSLEYYQNFGYIIQTPSSLVMFEITFHEGEYHFEVFLMVGSGQIPHMLQCMPLWCDKISFAREGDSTHKARTYDTADFCRRFGVDPEPIKKRCSHISSSGTSSPVTT